MFLKATAVLNKFLLRSKVRKKGDTFWLKMHCSEKHVGSVITWKLYIDSIHYYYLKTF